MSRAFRENGANVYNAMKPSGEAVTWPSLRRGVPRPVLSGRAFFEPHAPVVRARARPFEPDAGASGGLVPLSNLRSGAVCHGRSCPAVRFSNPRRARGARKVDASQPPSDAQCYLVNFRRARPFEPDAPSTGPYGGASGDLVPLSKRRACRARPLRTVISTEPPRERGRAEKSRS